RLVLPAAAVAWATAAIGLLVAPTPMPPPFLLLILVYFTVFETYAGVAVLRATRRAHGVTRRRLQLIAAGTLLLALTIGGAGVAIVLQPVGSFILPLALGSGIAYLLGFAPPGALRRAWQAPEVLAFVQRTGRLVGEAAPELVYATLAVELATASGEPDAGLGIWPAEREVLRFYRDRGEPIDRRLDESLAGPAFVQQRALVTAEDTGGRRQLPAEFRRDAPRYVLAAPLTVGSRRIGVASILVHTRSAFFEDDLALLELLSTQTAIVLEHRLLFDEG